MRHWIQNNMEAIKITLFFLSLLFGQYLAGNVGLRASGIENYSWQLWSANVLLNIGCVSLVLFFCKWLQTKLRASDA